MPKSFKEFIDPKLTEGVSPDAKAIMKEINKSMSFLKEDVKQSSTNGNWIGRLNELASTVDRAIKLAKDSKV